MFLTCVLTWSQAQLGSCRESSVSKHCFWEVSIPTKRVHAELCSAAEGFLLSPNNLGHFFSTGRCCLWCHSTSSFGDFVPYGRGRHRNAVGRSSWVQVKLFDVGG